MSVSTISKRPGAAKLPAHMAHLLTVTRTDETGKGYPAAVTRIENVYDSFGRLISAREVPA